MGIRFYCPNGHKLHVKQFQAGRRGICPHCEVRFRIPREGTPTAVSRNLIRADRLPPRSSVLRSEPGPPRQDAVGDAPAAETVTVSMLEGKFADQPAADASSADSWFVRPLSGGQFGPADERLLRAWIEEGRVSRDSLLWRQGWSDWREAAGVFPELITQPTANHELAEEARAKPATESPVPRRRRTGRSDAIPLRATATILFLAMAAAALLVLLVLIVQKS